MTNEEKISALIAQQTTIGRVPFDGANFYSKQSKNRYAIYSISIDRFILVDRLDLWVTLTCAKLLSSKIPLAVFALSDDVPEFTQDDCIFWTITNKNFTQSEGQTPPLSRLITSDSIKRDGAPVDYTSDEQIQMLIELQNYALFSMRVLYALQLADAMSNPDDHVFYSRLIDGNIANMLEVRGDQTAIPNGALIAVQRALYMSSSVDEAYAEINRLWAMPRQGDAATRTRFYKFLGQPEIEVVRATLPTF